MAYSKTEPIRNHYKTLGIGLNSDALQIKKAYKRLVSIYHPDKNIDAPQAADVFLEIQEAYTILKDPISRKAYHTKLLMEQPQLAAHSNSQVMLPPAAQLHQILRDYQHGIKNEDSKSNLYSHLFNLINIQFVFELAQAINKDTKEQTLATIAALAEILKPKNGIEFLNSLSSKMQHQLLRMPTIAMVVRQLRRKLLWQSISPWLIIVLAACICLLLYLLGR